MHHSTPSASKKDGWMDEGKGKGKGKGKDDGRLDPEQMMLAPQYQPQREEGIGRFGGME